jgi:hypothetical protein
MRDAIINREWASYEILTESINEAGENFNTLESERIALFDKLSQSFGFNGDEKERFYALAARFPEEKRKEFTGIYRELKMETLKIKLANDTLMEYLSGAKAAVTGLLESVYPDRKGRLYTRNGVKQEADMRSVVLNRTF